MADKINDAVVGEVHLKLTLGEVIEANGHRRPAVMERRVAILGKDIEVRGMTAAVLAALNQARDDLVGVVTEA